MLVVYAMLALVRVLTGPGPLRALRKNNPTTFESLQLNHIYPY